MPSNPNRLFRFWQELKRRKVGRVITVYAAASFVILELASIIVEPLKLPEWTVPMVIVLLLLGFILAVVFSWIYDITPEGIQKTISVTQSGSSEKKSSRKGSLLAFWISIAVLLAFGIFYLSRQVRRSTAISKLEKSIAVLPFENWSAEEEHAHLGNALANEIITELYKVHDFHVISYTSSARYQDPGTLSIPQIGKELGANFIIEGTVERQNDEVSIHVQVIHAIEDDHLWANKFKGKWEDIFDIQDEIALPVGRHHLTGQLNPFDVEINKQDIFS